MMLEQEDWSAVAASINYRNDSRYSFQVIEKLPQLQKLCSVRALQVLICQAEQKTIADKYNRQMCLAPVCALNPRSEDPSVFQG